MSCIANESSASSNDVVMPGLESILSSNVCLKNVQIAYVSLMDFVLKMKLLSVKL